MFDNQERSGYIFCFKTRKHWEYFQHLHSKLFIDETNIAWNTILSDQYLNQVIQVSDAHINNKTLPEDKKGTYFPKANIIFIQRNEANNASSLTAKSLSGSYLIFKDDDYIQWIGWMEKIATAQKEASRFRRRSQSLLANAKVSEIESDFEEKKQDGFIDEAEERVHAIPTPPSVKIILANADEDEERVHSIPSPPSINSEADRAEITVSNSEDYELINDVDHTMDSMEEKCAGPISSVTTPTSQSSVIDDIVRNKRRWDKRETVVLMSSFLFMGVLTAGYWKYSSYQRARLEQEEQEYLEMLRHQEIEANMQELATNLYQDAMFLAKLVILIIIILINCCCCCKVYCCKRSIHQNQIKKKAKRKYKRRRK